MSLSETLCTGYQRNKQWGQRTQVPALMGSRSREEKAVVVFIQEVVHLGHGFRLGLTEGCSEGMILQQRLR